MTPKELKRRLATEGWDISQGGKHELATNPSRAGVKIAIPRHAGDIPTGTLNKTLKDAGLK
ncbi:MAG: type II toxin-antitoxin system HicA family toxin [Lachnospiraceae bacterium]|nr:type II toxin-antitoxin system HicA family toxin [Lachnospiraceae bacterium]